MKLELLDIYDNTAFFGNIEDEDQGQQLEVTFEATVESWTEWERIPGLQNFAQDFEEKELTIKDYSFPYGKFDLDEDDNDFVIRSITEHMENNPDEYKR
jgi:hypothetical protein